MGRYSFSGHESFQCKSLWLKKGYDFLLNHNNFNDTDAVAKLGVGKNMVSSIRFWMRAFGLTKTDELQPISTYLLDTENGVDPFLEDINSLWLLHFLIVSTEVASIYHLLFIDYQREKREFNKNDLLVFIKLKCSGPEQRNVFNENTVRKDIGVFLKNYVAPSNLKIIEDFSSLLINLGLIISKGNERYLFRTIGKDEIAPEIILYALLRLKKEDFTVSFDILQKISLIFNLSMTLLIEVIYKLENIFPNTLVFTDNSGIKNVQFLRKIDEIEVLNHYYRML